jgi:hypothetical protein
LLSAVGISTYYHYLSAMRDKRLRSRKPDTCGTTDDNNTLVLKPGILHAFLSIRKYKFSSWDKLKGNLEV